MEYDPVGVDGGDVVDASRRHGGRTAPSVCNIGEKWIEIRANVRLTGRGGRVYEKIDTAAKKNARTIKQTNPTWTWADRDPSEKR